MSSRLTEVRARIAEHPRYRWIVLATVLVGVATNAFPVTVFTAAIPTIAEDLNTTDSTIAWVFAAPTIAFAVFTPIAGKLGDLYGHRRAYLIGYGGAVVLILLTATAWSAGSLIALRTLGQSTGAITSPAAVAIIMATFDVKERPVAMGYWAATVSAAPALGLVLGGPLIDSFGWRWLFVLQTFPAVLALLIALPVLPDTPRKANVKFDLAGSFTLGIGVAGLLFAINRSLFWGFTHPAVLAAGIIGITALRSFVSIERSHPSPLLALETIRLPNVRIPLVANLLLSMAYNGPLILTSLLLSRVFGYREASAIALVILPRPVAFSISSWIAGRAQARLGARTLIMGGVLVMASGLAVMGVAAMTESVPLLVGGLVLTGAGFGAHRPALVTTVGESVAAEDMGVTTGALNMLGQIGMAIGVATLTGLVGDTAIISRFVTAFWVSSAIAMIALVVASRMVIDRRDQP